MIETILKIFFSCYMVAVVMYVGYVIRKITEK